MVEPCATGGFKTRPSVGDQVSFTVRRIHADGTPTAGTVVQDAELERYVLGSNLQCRAIEVALETMREGECSVFLCNERHLPAPNIESPYPEEVTVRLNKIHRDVDLTHKPSPGGSLTKHRVKWGSAKTHGNSLYDGMQLAQAPRPGFGSDAGREVARPGCRVVALQKPKGDEGPHRLLDFILRSTASNTNTDTNEANEAVHEALELGLELSSPGERFELTFSRSVYGQTDSASSEFAVSDADASRAYSERYDKRGDDVTLDVFVQNVYPPAPFAPEHAGPGGWGGTQDVGLDGEDVWTMPKSERIHRSVFLFLCMFSRGRFE